MGAANVVENRRPPTSVRRHLADDVALPSRPERVEAGQRAAHIDAVMIDDINELTRPNVAVVVILSVCDDRSRLLIP